MKMTGITLLLSASLFLHPLPAPCFDNQSALDELTHSKAVFDINQGDPAILLLRLQLVEQSWKQLHEAGTSPDFILTFRGSASYFLTRGNTFISPEDHQIKQQIYKQVQTLSALGLRLEQCAIAAKLADIPTSEFLPEINVVANGYVSLIAYQNRGYAFIPME